MGLLTRKLRVRGTVQGVGFRPFVYVIAVTEGLKGTVLNDGKGVEIILQGSKSAQNNFDVRFKKELPPLASVDTVEESIIDHECELYPDFRIVESKTTEVTTGIPADAAVCKDCLRELTDRTNRRYRYPFINCTHCGPRYTITSHLPYDRPQTSMRVFPMCPSCLKEYKDPFDRRFHAQPNACPDCGPQVELLNEQGQKVQTADPIKEVFKLIKDGKIVAVKGLGGFHLVCDARNEIAVNELRKRKNRPSKPFAIMASNLQSLKDFVVISKESEELLTSSAAPIVLCTKKSQADTELKGIAPGLSTIGVMLPYTPIHWLLLYEACNRSETVDLTTDKIETILVMTSANAGGEPLVISNEEAVEQLNGIADYYLIHNRDILIRCDDSVIKSGDGQSIKAIRRARGYSPKVTKLDIKVPPIIATGSWLKNTACVAKNDKAILSQHIGDLDRVSNCQTLKKAVEHLSELFEIKPEIIVCDMHPDFYSTHLAEELADKYNAKLMPVQHHHAHIASVMAQHNLKEPVLGLALDGVGLGLDGKSWGGEILLVNPNGFERLAHLKELKLPGGDKCSREGWRIAVGFLTEQGLTSEVKDLFNNRPYEPITRLIESGFPVPSTTSLGRTFDLAAALLQVKDYSTYEGEAPILLEVEAEGVEGEDLKELVSTDGSIINLDPLLLSLAKREDKTQAAADFHKTVAYAFANKAIELAKNYNLNKVCLSGGCCLNDLLTGLIKKKLNDNNLEVYESVDIPCNDGGLALGQIWVAAMEKDIGEEK